jgi:hypothetical protein
MTPATPHLPPDLLSEALSALPVPVLIMDEGLHVLYVNEAAQALMGEQPPWLKTHRCGDVLQCVNALRPGACCGETEDCPRCVVRQSVVGACQEQSTVTARALIRRQGGGEDEFAHVLVRAQGLTHEGLAVAILMLQDIPELIETSDILRMCAWCHKVNSDGEAWEELPGYLNRQLSLAVSHGMCPDCAQRCQQDMKTKNEGAS